MSAERIPCVIEVYRFSGEEAAAVGCRRASSVLMIGVRLCVCALRPCAFVRLFWLGVMACCCVSVFFYYIFTHTECMLLF